MSEPGGAERSAGGAAPLLAAAAAGGAAVLGLEVLSARMLAPALGSGPEVWAWLLATALAALAAGNLAGGLLADRACPRGLLAWALAAAALALVLLGVLHRPLVSWSAGLPAGAGAPAAALMLQGFPLLALGAVAPAVLKGGRAEGPGSGRWAGAALAAGSAGAVAGALLVGLWSLPALGLMRSSLFLALLPAAAAVPVALAGRRYAAGTLALLTAIASAALWLAGGPEHTVQSRHGQIEVRESGDGRTLLIDGLPQTALPYGPVAPWDGLRHGCLLETALLAGRQPQSALVIGLGAGLASRLLEAHGLRCLTVELDPGVVEIARRDFGFVGPVEVADGRAYLARSRERWDLIVLDVCTSERLPWQLFTVEALSAARERLAPGGVLAIQFIGDDGPWTASLARTAERVFGRAVVLRPRIRLAPVATCVLLAGAEPLPPVPDDPTAPWQAIGPQGGAVLTDEHFPAERDWARVAAAWRRSY